MPSSPKPAVPKAPRQRPGSACVSCRSRKLRCDGVLPTCGSCADASIACEPPLTVQARRGPKKGHMKAMQQRIAQLELEVSNMRGAETATVKLARLPDACEKPQEVFENVAKDVPTPRSDAQSPAPTPAAECDSMTWMQSEGSPTKMVDDYMLLNFDVDASAMQIDLDHLEHLEQLDHIGTDFAHLPISMIDPFISPAQSTGPNTSEYFSLANVDPELGAQSDPMRGTLNDLYFSRVHPIILVHHKRNYFSWADNAIKTDAQQGLQFAMWALAASLSAGTQHMAPELYSRARAMLDTWQASQPFQEPPEVERVQTYLLLTIYEVTRIGVQRACMTGSYCFRLVQLLHWHELDASQQRQTISSTQLSNALESSVLLEEKRRSFWVAFALDRFISLSSGWPLTLNDNVISTRLPCPEAEYQEADMASKLAMPFPSDALSAGTLAVSSPLTDMVMFSIVSGRILEHSQRTEVEQSMTEGALRRKERHDWLQRTVAAGSDTTSQKYGSGQHNQHLEADPMAIFNQMLAHMNVLSIGRVTKLHPISPLEDPSSSMSEASYSAAQEIFRLSRLLAEFSYLKIHPFTPLPLFICADFFRSCPSQLDPSAASKVEEIQNLLSHMSSMNRLALSYLRNWSLLSLATVPYSAASPTANL